MALLYFALLSKTIGYLNKVILERNKNIETLCLKIPSKIKIRDKREVFLTFHFQIGRPLACCLGGRWGSR